MAAWTYYRKERERHPDALATKLTEAQVLDMVATLCTKFNAGPIPVNFHDKIKRNGSKWSTFTWSRSGGAYHYRIEFHRDMLTALTVVHEVMHYCHWLGWKDVRDEAMTRPGWTLADLPRVPRWHGVEHRELVDRGVAFLKAQGLINPATPAVPPTPASVVVPEAIVPAVDPKTAWWVALPAEQHCNRCKCDRHKDHFGMRVIKREGKSDTYARQGYCASCRKEYAELKKTGEAMKKAA